MFWSSIHCGCLFPVFLPSLCINGGVRSPNSVAGVTAGNVRLWKKQKAERTCRHSTFLPVLYVYFSLIAETSSVDILPRPLGWRNACLWCSKYTNSPCIQEKKKKHGDVLWHVFAFSCELSRKTSKDQQAASDYRKFHLKAFIVRWRAVNVHPSSQHFNDQSIPPLPQFQHWFRIMQSCEITLSWWLVLKWFFSTPRGLASFIPQRNKDDVSDSRQCRSWADWHLLREKVSPPTLHDFPSG